MADLPWFRFYNETINDVKFKRVSRELQADTLTIIGAWAVILCLASRSPQRGKLYLTDEEPYSIDDIADALNWQAQDTAMLIDEFVGMGMIRSVDGGLEITNWDKRQYESDSARNRMRTYRNKLRNSDVTVTPPDTDSDTDSDSDSSSSGGPQKNIFTMYTEIIGSIPPTILVDELKDYEQRHPPEHLQRAFEIAAGYNKRNWAYPKSILDRWNREGYDGDKLRTPRNGNGSKPTQQSEDELMKEIMEELKNERRR